MFSFYLKRIVNPTNQAFPRATPPDLQRRRGRPAHDSMGDILAGAYATLRALGLPVNQY